MDSHVAETASIWHHIKPNFITSWSPGICTYRSNDSVVCSVATWGIISLIGHEPSLESGERGTLAVNDRCCHSYILNVKNLLSVGGLVVDESSCKGFFCRLKRACAEPLPNLAIDRAGKVCNLIDLVWNKSVWCSVPWGWVDLDLISCHVQALCSRHSFWSVPVKAKDYSRISTLWSQSLFLSKCQCASWLCPVNPSTIPRSRLLEELMNSECDVVIVVIWICAARYWKLVAWKISRVSPWKRSPIINVAD